MYRSADIPCIETIPRVVRTQRCDGKQFRAIPTCVPTKSAELALLPAHGLVSGRTSADSHNYMRMTCVPTSGMVPANENMIIKRVCLLYSSAFSIHFSYLSCFTWFIVYILMHKYSTNILNDKVMS